MDTKRGAMRITLSALIVLGVLVASGQVVHINRPAQTRPDLEDLRTRVSESEFLVTGRLVELKSVLRRPSQPYKQSGEGVITVRVSSDENSGNLFTVAVRGTVCRQSDFAAGTAQTETPAGGLLSIFVPRGELPVQSELDGRRHSLSEYLAFGKDYLLFLRKDPRQAEMVSRYQLDPGLTYYRTYEGDRGAVELPDAAHQGQPRDFVIPLVSAVTTLCDAVKPSDAETKIRNLNAVRDQFADPAWRKSVDDAINALQKAQVQPTQPR